MALKLSMPTPPLRSRGALVAQPWLRFHTPLIGRVGDWRAGLGRSLYSRLAFCLRVSHHPGRATFPAPCLVERSRWISRTALSCLLRPKGYGTHPAGAAFGTGRTTR